eukprot:2087324-Rhodomonas_salina.1
MRTLTEVREPRIARRPFPLHCRNIVAFSPTSCSGGPHQGRRREPRVVCVRAGLVAMDVPRHARGGGDGRARAARGAARVLGR